MKVTDPQRLPSRVEFECPACQCRLERRVSGGEKALVLVGSLALFAAALLSILSQMDVLRAQVFAKPLFLLAAVVGIVEIRNEFVRRRFYVASEV